MKYLILLLILSALILTSCNNKDKDLINMRDCQESCLSSNMSFNSLNSFNDNSSKFIKCECVKYLKVN